MADPGASLPLDFAQAVLSVRGALAQKAAEIRELKQRRITEQILEEERLRIQEMSARLAAGTAQARTESEERVDTARIRSGERIAQGNQEIDREVAAATIRKEEQAAKDREAGLIADITTRFGRGDSVFVPMGIMAKLPKEILGGSPITEEGTGRQIPSRTYAEIPAEDGSGTWYVKLTDQLQQAEYDSLRAQKAQRESSSALAEMRKRLVSEQTERIRKMALLVNKMSPRERVTSLKDLAEMRLVHDFRAERLRREGKLDELDKLEAQMMNDEKVIRGLAVEEWEKGGGSRFDTSGAGAASSLRPADLGDRRELFRPAASTEEPPAETTGLMEAYGLFNRKTGKFRPTSSSISRHRSDLTPDADEVGAVLKTYLEKGRITREVLESLGGSVIEERQNAPQTNPQANAQADPEALSAYAGLRGAVGKVLAPPSAAPATTPGLTPEEEARANAMVDKLNSGQRLTPEEQAEFDRIQAILEAAARR